MSRSYRLFPVLLVFLALLSVAAPGVLAQELQIDVSESSGTAEIEIPGSAWFQAVTGRSVPVGARLATWTQARSGFELVESEATASVSLGELSLMTLTNATGRLEIELTVGTATVAVEGVEVEVRAGDASVWTSSASFVLSPTEVAVISGEVVLTYRGTQTLLTGESARLTPHRPQPLLTPPGID